MSNDGTRHENVPISFSVRAGFFDHRLWIRTIHDGCVRSGPDFAVMHEPAAQSKDGIDGGEHYVPTFQRLESISISGAPFASFWTKEGMKAQTTHFRILENRDGAKEPMHTTCREKYTVLSSGAVKII